MSGKIGLFTGSFDPITLGHVNLIERASRLFDQLYVGLLYNQDKIGFFPLETRLTMLTGALAHLSNVCIITSTDQLAVNIARQHQVTHLVRGVRNVVDLDYEDSLAYFNGQLAPELETLILLSAPQYRQLSSSRVRELIHFRTDVTPYVPASVLIEVEKRYDHS